jgi:hypothetical protein
MFSFCCKGCGDQEQFAATVKCVVCFMYTDWTKNMESEFKAKVCEVMAPPPLPVDGNEEGDGEDEGEVSGASEESSFWHHLDHVDFELLLTRTTGGYFTCDENLTLAERVAKLTEFLAELPGAAAHDTALEPLIQDFAARVDAQAKASEFHVMGEYDMHGNATIEGLDEPANVSHHRETVEWTKVDGQEVNARPKWAYCHGVSTHQGEREHGILAGDLRRCCPFDVTVFQAMPKSDSSATIRIMRTPAAVGEGWDQMVQNYDSLGARYVQAQNIHAQMKDRLGGMMGGMMGGFGGMMNPPEDPRLELWSKAHFSFRLTTPPRVMAEYVQELLAEGRVAHLAIARHGIVGEELLNGLAPRSPPKVGSGGLAAAAFADDVEKEVPTIPRPLVQAVSLVQPETVKALLDYGASKGVDEAMVAAQAALEAAQAEVARLHEPGQPAAVAAKAHCEVLADRLSDGDGRAEEPLTLPELEAALTYKAKCQEVLAVFEEHKTSWFPILTFMRAQCGRDGPDDGFMIYDGSSWCGLSEADMAGYTAQTLIKQAYKAMGLPAPERGSLFERAQRCVARIEEYKKENHGSEDEEEEEEAEAAAVIEEEEKPPLPVPVERKRSADVAELPEREAAEAQAAEHKKADA